MAGEIQLNSTSFASESSGTITINNATVGSAVAMSANQACVKTALNASGSAPIYACRAWVNFNGTGTVAIRDSGNVSSITDNGGSGIYTVNFATAMPDANYCKVFGGSQVSGVGNNGTIGVYPDSAEPTASALRILATVGNSPNDFAHIDVAIFR
uniref:Putative alpha amylase, C-terminal all-beta domain protein n=1 Tax=uncultured marine microorganism HF4000_48F7 TaxID=455500 RepID=B3SZV0_9ZZZZ|nr:putative alpha amylase, C-terminal all-beta domain protein [uncultured marine microorganism HF4000_48F7]